MNEQQLELFRVAGLRVFESNNTRFGLGVPALCHAMAVFGFPSPDQEAVKDMVQYWLTREFLEEVQKHVSRENRAWRITTKGLQFLDSGGV